MSICFISSKDQKSHDSDMCEKNLNLLAHAQAIELDIGSVCGGHGVCGGDRVRIDPIIQKSFSAPTEAELEHLSAEEIEQGWRLACQCFPNQNDLTVKAEF